MTNVRLLKCFVTQKFYHSSNHVLSRASLPYNIGSVLTFFLMHTNGNSQKTYFPYFKVTLKLYVWENNVVTELKHVTNKNYI